MDPLLKGKLSAEIRSLALQVEGEMSKLDVAKGVLAQIENKNASLCEEMKNHAAELSSLKTQEMESRTEGERLRLLAEERMSQLSTIESKLERLRQELEAFLRQSEKTQTATETNLALLMNEASNIASENQSVKKEIDEARSLLSHEQEALERLRSERLRFEEECAAKDVERSEVWMKKEEEMNAREVECGKREERMELKRQTLLSYKKDLENYYNRSFPNLII